MVETLKKMTDEDRAAVRLAVLTKGEGYARLVLERMGYTLTLQHYGLDRAKLLADKRASGERRNRTWEYHCRSRRKANAASAYEEAFKNALSRGATPGEAAALAETYMRYKYGGKPMQDGAVNGQIIKENNERLGGHDGPKWRNTYGHSAGSSLRRQWEEAGCPGSFENFIKEARASVEPQASGS